METHTQPTPGLHEFAREKSGVVYTKSWVVDLLLDLVGYTTDKPLARMLLVEPSAGDGSFLLRAASRLIESCRRCETPLIEARSAILAFEIEEASAEKARRSLWALLRAHGARPGDAELLTDAWVRTGDYLLESRSLRGSAHFVVGNPPYIRLEDLPDGGSAYRSSYLTMRGRADIYVAFFEAALMQLAPEGACGFICADRWMFNQYGSELRKLVTTGFSVDTIAQMHLADAFEEKVSAYPAVTVIRKGRQGPVVVASLEAGVEGIGASNLAALLSGMAAGGSMPIKAARLDRWFRGSEPWSLIAPEKQALLRRLEAEFPSLEGTGAKVGIGVATGADKVFITTDTTIAESERLIPLALAQDVRSGGVAWSGNYLVNPWEGKRLVDLSNFPTMARHFEKHRHLLERRHVGKRNPGSWFRTIDRVDDNLLAAPKLYLPDMSGRIDPVLDEGGTYPHHNLYFIAPGLWNPKVLGGLLLSDVAQFFIEAYGVRMRGGYLRFQAQFLRRICLPFPSSLERSQELALVDAFESRDVEAANVVAAKVFELSREEISLL